MENTMKKFTFTDPYDIGETDITLLNAECLSPVGDFAGWHSDFKEELADIKPRRKTLYVKEKEKIVRVALLRARCRYPKGHPSRTNPHASVIDFECLEYLSEAIQGYIQNGKHLPHAKRLSSFYGSLVRKIYTFTTEYLLTFDTQYDEKIGLDTRDGYVSPLQTFLERV